MKIPRHLLLSATLVAVFLSTQSTATSAESLDVGYSDSGSGSLGDSFEPWSASRGDSFEPVGDDGESKDSSDSDDLSDDDLVVLVPVPMTSDGVRHLRAMADAAPAAGARPISTPHASTSSQPPKLPERNETKVAPPTPFTAPANITNTTHPLTAPTNLANLTSTQPPRLPERNESKSVPTPLPIAANFTNATHLSTSTQLPKLPGRNETKSTPITFATPTNISMLPEQNVSRPNSTAVAPLPANGGDKSSLRGKL